MVGEEDSTELGNDVIKLSMMLGRRFGFASNFFNRRRYKFKTLNDSRQVPELHKSSNHPYYNKRHGRLRSQKNSRSLS